VARPVIRDAYRQYTEPILLLHRSQNAGKGWDSHLPVYMDGVLPLAEFLGDLADGGFAGNVSIELDLRSWLNDEDALHEVIRRNKEFCEANLAVSARRA